jgi:hypothetical protein
MIAPNHTSGVLGSTFHGKLLVCPQQALFYLREHGGQGGDATVSSKNPALDRGTAVHLMLAHHYKRLQDEQNDRVSEWLPATEAVMTAQENGQVGRGYSWTWNAIVELYEQYCDAWASQDSRWKILAVEEPLSFFFGTGLRHRNSGSPLDSGADDRFEYRPTVDLVVYDSKFDMTIGFDHKTTSKLSEDTGKQYQNHAQFIGMSLALKSNYSGLVKVGVNLVQVGGKSLYGLKSTIHNEFARPQFYVSSQQELAWAATMNRRRRHLQFVLAEDEAVERTMDEKVCYATKYGSACEFFDKCCGKD